MIRSIFPLIAVTLFAWSLHPHFCCSTEFYISPAAACAVQAADAGGQPDTADGAASLVKADSKLVKTDATGNPELQPALNGDGFSVPSNHLWISNPEPGNTRVPSAPTPPLKHPPRIV